MGPASRQSAKAPRAKRTLLLPEGILAPGLVDLQINGAAGVDFLSCRDEQQLVRVRRYLAATGVTSFLPTLISSPRDRLRAALAHWQRLAAQSGGPRVLGVHIEGPYRAPCIRLITLVQFVLEAIDLQSSRSLAALPLFQYF